MAPSSGIDPNNKPAEADSTLSFCCSLSWLTLRTEDVSGLFHRKILPSPYYEVLHPTRPQCFVFFMCFYSVFFVPALIYLFIALLFMLILFIIKHSFLFQFILCFISLLWHAIEQLGEALCYKPEGRGFDSR
jgi:hypothetical protein